MSKTKVINLFGGAGSGKSTLAAAIFYELKMRGLRAELVGEYVKQRAWTGQKIEKFDQFQIFGQQSYSESVLYEKVDFIVTDSPLMLIPFYEQKLNQTDMLLDTVNKFMKYAEIHGVTYHNFWLERPKFYDTKGRYQTKEEATEIDLELKKFLHDHNHHVTSLPKDDKLRIKEVLKEIGVWELPYLD